MENEFCEMFGESNPFVISEWDIWVNVRGVKMINISINQSYSWFLEQCDYKIFFQFTFRMFQIPSAPNNAILASAVIMVETSCCNPPADTKSLICALVPPSVMLARAQVDSFRTENSSWWQKMWSYALINGFILVKIYRQNMTFATWDLFLYFNIHKFKRYRMADLPYSGLDQQYLELDCLNSSRPILNWLTFAWLAFAWLAFTWLAFTQNQNIS